MISLIARGLPRQTLENVLRHKGLRYVVQDGEQFRLEHNGIAIKDPVLAVQYLDRKFQYPPVFPDEPELYVKILHHLKQLFDGIATVADYIRVFAAHGHPWIAIRFTVLDLALEPLMQDPEYSARIYQMRNHDGYDI